MTIPQNTAPAKLHKLQSLLEEIGSALVAFSGGVDSTFLLKVAVDTLGDRALAVTCHSEAIPARELSEAVDLAKRLGARHRLIRTTELESPVYASNPPDRCYHCKMEVFGQLVEIARDEGLAAVLDGSNRDDVGDYRPGTKAARELGVRSPLQEVGLDKAEIRALSRELGLPTWNKPSYACLSSRIPYGQTIDATKLGQIDVAEAVLHELGYHQVRVRHHGDLARIELAADEVPQFAASPALPAVVKKLKELGFLYVTLDMQGYRTGSMNEGLAKPKAE